MEIRGDKVKQLRIDRGWTQAQLAEICDVNLRTIQRVENLGSASVETIMSLCAAFDIKRQILFKVPEQTEIQQTSSLSKGLIALVFFSGVIIGAGSAIIPFIFFN